MLDGCGRAQRAPNVVVLGARLGSTPATQDSRRVKALTLFSKWGQD